MGKCPNCGHSAIFLTRIPCRICGKYACDKCAISLFDLRNANVYLDTCYVCTEQCKETFVLRFMEQLTTRDIPIDESVAVDKIPSLVRQSLMSPKNKDWLDKEWLAYIDRKMRDDFYVDFGSLKGDSSSAESLLERLSNCIRLIVVKHLVTARRFEDAAKLYEKLGMYEEAGKVRAKGGEISVKRTEVSVDLNTLLREVKEGGIVVVYRCPNCGGKVKVSKETSVDSLKYCEHCGSKIETMDLAEFLRTALS
jgi:DNA-directed RNA polymerase subunit RPC12/RpoP